MTGEKINGYSNASLTLEIQELTTRQSSSTCTSNLTSNDKRASERLGTLATACHVRRQADERSESDMSSRNGKDVRSDIRLLPSSTSSLEVP